MNVTTQFRALADRIVDDLLEADPVAATDLGDHRFDGRLTDHSREAAAVRLRSVDDHLAHLDAVDDVELQIDDLVDLEILRAVLLGSRFEIDELRHRQWDPLVWNPGTALHQLVSRAFAPQEQRAADLRSRLTAIPDVLADARSSLGNMPRVHVETAIDQFAGTERLLDGEVRALAADDAGVDRAAEAVRDFRQWLQQRLPDADASPRLGGRLYAAALWHGLDDTTSADELLSAAQAHLDLVTDQLVEAAARLPGIEHSASGDVLVRAALDEVARRGLVTDQTVLPLMRQAMDRSADFVRARDLVGVEDVDVRVIDMPMIHRGVAVAYCDAPGPLEPADVPTFVAVAPTPTGWGADRVASFYREYNATQLHDLAIHEAVPGHVLQLAHARRCVANTRVRRFARSGMFVEGWAVYAEELMVRHGYVPDEDPWSAAALRLQQLKMQARMTINTILDIGVHAHDMPEDEGLALMRGRGFQEQGEAVGKWRRALLTAAQLPTYFAGLRAVSSIVGDLRVLHPDWSDRQLHDLLLSQGSPPPRHLRTLLGI